MGADRRLTVVFPGATSPPRDGASSFVRAVLALLVREGHEAHLVVPSFLDPVEPLSVAYAAQTSRWLRIPVPEPVFRARLARTAAAVAHASPAWVEAYARPDVVAEVRRSAGPAGVIVGFGASSSSILRAAAAPSLLLLFSLPLDDLIRAHGSRFDRRLTGAFQARLPDRHDVVAATTPAEQERLSDEAIWLPYPREHSTAGDRPPGDRRRLLFIADWNYPPNRLGLEFLLGNVMPEVWRHHPDTELVLAGKGSDDLETGFPDPRVHGFGQYGELAEIVDGSTVAVLPLLGAGGVRTRLLELGAAGVPVVATYEATGRGEPGPGVIAASPDDFGARLLEVLSSPAAELQLRRGARAGGGMWPSDAEVTASWRSAVELAVRRHGGRTRPGTAPYG